MERFTMVRHADHEHCGLETDPNGAFVLFKDHEARLADLLRAIQIFRNCPALGPLTDLRGTQEYAVLCNAWYRHALNVYGETPEGMVNAPTLNIPAGA